MLMISRGLILTKKPHNLFVYCGSLCFQLVKKSMVPEKRQVSFDNKNREKVSQKDCGELLRTEKVLPDIVNLSDQPRT